MPTRINTSSTRALPPELWTERDLISYARKHYGLGRDAPLLQLIAAEKLTPRALWYLQTDADEVARLSAQDAPLQEQVYDLAQHVRPSVSPTTPRIIRAQQLSEDLNVVPPPPPSPPPPEEPEPEEDEDAALSVVSDWNLDEAPEDERLPPEPEGEEVEEEEEYTGGDDSFATETGPAEGLGLDLGGEEAEPEAEAAPEEEGELIDLEDENAANDQVASDEPPQDPVPETTHDQETTNTEEPEAVAQDAPATGPRSREEGKLAAVEPTEAPEREIAKNELAEPIASESAEESVAHSAQDEASKCPRAQPISEEQPESQQPESSREQASEEPQVEIPRVGYVSRRLEDESEDGASGETSGAETSGAETPGESSVMENAASADGVESESSPKEHPFFTVEGQAAAGPALALSPEGLASGEDEGENKVHADEPPESAPVLENSGTTVPGPTSALVEAADDTEVSETHQDALGEPTSQGALLGVAESHSSNPSPSPIPAAEDETPEDKTLSAASDKLEQNTGDGVPPAVPTPAADQPSTEQPVPSATEGKAGGQTLQSEPSSDEVDTLTTVDKEHSGAASEGKPGVLESDLVEPLPRPRVSTSPVERFNGFASAVRAMSLGSSPHGATPLYRFRSTSPSGQDAPGVREGTSAPTMDDTPPIDNPPATPGTTDPLEAEANSGEQDPSPVPLDPASDSTPNATGTASESHALAEEGGDAASVQSHTSSYSTPSQESANTEPVENTIASPGQANTTTNPALALNIPTSNEFPSLSPSTPRSSVAWGTASRGGMSSWLARGVGHLSMGFRPATGSPTQTSEPALITTDSKVLNVCDPSTTKSFSTPIQAISESSTVEPSIPVASENCALNTGLTTSGLTNNVAATGNDPEEAVIISHEDVAGGPSGDTGTGMDGAGDDNDADGFEHVDNPDTPKQPSASNHSTADEGVGKGHGASTADGASFAKESGGRRRDGNEQQDKRERTASGASQPSRRSSPQRDALGNVVPQDACCTIVSSRPSRRKGRSRR